jgi:RNA polymerase sigma factor (sigma-70 family)
MKNSRDSLSVLYQEQVDALYSYGCKFTADRGLVKDCIHDVFVKLYEKEDISAIRNLKFYLLRSFKNRLLDELSRVQPENIDEATFSYLHEVSDESRLLEINETEQLLKDYVEKIFENLTGRQKEAIYLYYIEELTYEEICEMLGMNYQSVRNLIHRALIRLREKFGNQPPVFLFFIFFQKK